MGELEFANILSPEEIDTLFDDNQNESKEETSKKVNENNEEKTKETTEEEINPEDLFSPESVGRGKEDNKEKEDTKPDGSGTSPKKPNFYSSIASALTEDGIFQNLDEKELSEITDAEGFASAMRKEIQAQFDERQKRIDEALNLGIEPSEIQNYERTLHYLDSIKDENISDESEKGEQLRRQLIYNDFINRGYSQERANREVKKSFDAGTDIEDAKESLKSNKEFFQNSYNSLLDKAREEEEKYNKKRHEEADALKKSILEEDKIFGDLQVDKTTRQKAFDAISKPVWKDPETGDLYTAVQKYERDNRVEFMKNLGLIYTLTDGFKNLDRLVKGKVRKEVKKGLKELETTINSTSYGPDGNLRFVGGSEDPESKEGWRLDI